jgi:hypothetical protein
MASSEMKPPPAGAAMPSWRAPQVLLTAAVRSSSLLGHDLINRFRAERYELFLSGHFALWASAGVVLPLLEYVFWYRTPYVLLFAAVGELSFRRPQRRRTGGLPHPVDHRCRRRTAPPRT